MSVQQNCCAQIIILAVKFDTDRVNKLLMGISFFAINGRIQLFQFIALVFDSSDWMIRHVLFGNTVVIDRVLKIKLIIK